MVTKILPWLGQCWQLPQLWHEPFPNGPWVTMHSPEPIPKCPQLIMLKCPGLTIPKWPAVIIHSHELISQITGSNKEPTWPISEITGSNKAQRTGNNNAHIWTISQMTGSNNALTWTIYTLTGSNNALTWTIYTLTGSNNALSNCLKSGTFHIFTTKMAYFYNYFYWLWVTMPSQQLVPIWPGVTMPTHKKFQ